MKPFAEFCAHYQLDPASAAARTQYDAYGFNLTLFRRAMADKQEIESPAHQPADVEQQSTRSQGGDV